MSRWQALNPLWCSIRCVFITAHSVSRASGLEQEEDGEADDEPRHDERQRRRRSSHAEVLHQRQAALFKSALCGTRMHCNDLADCCCQCYPYLEEAFAGGHLDGDRGGEADHGRAAQPYVRSAATAALLRALLAPDGQRPAGGPARDAAVAGADAQCRCCIRHNASQNTK